MKSLGPLIALSAFALTATEASAGLEESTAEVLILPLAIAGLERTSDVTLSNGSNTPVEVRGTWFGAIGSPLEVSRAGRLDCGPVAIQPLGAQTVALADLCPALRTPDRENVGYLRLWVESDRRAYIGASIVTTTGDGAQFRIDAEPLGAHDIAAPIVRFALHRPFGPFRDLDPLQVHGLEGEVASRGGSRELVARCWVAAPDGAKQIDLSLYDEAGMPIGQPISVALRDGEMEAVDVFDRAGLLPGRYERVRVVLSTPASTSAAGGVAFSREAIVAGCGTERLAARQIDYRRARTPAPSDATRQPIVDADWSTSSGPFLIGQPILNTVFGDTENSKAVVAIFVQPEDQIVCRAVVRNPRFSGQLAPPLELQVKDAAGRVVAGGDGVRQTAVFETGPRDRPGGALDGPWTVEVSLDESAYAAIPPMTGVSAGLWGLMCESAAGLSQAILQTRDGFKPFADDF